MRPKPDPTHDEIEKRCHDVQRAWSRRERWKRAGKPRPPHWNVPLIRVGEIAEAACDTMGMEGDDR